MRLRPRLRIICWRDSLEGFMCRRCRAPWCWRSAFAARTRPCRRRW
jgi:hypothetical protein